MNSNQKRPPSHLGKPMNNRPRPSSPSRTPAAQGKRVREQVDGGALLALWRDCFGENPQSSLSQLCGHAKDSRAVALLNEQVERPRLRGLLEHPLPKVRKNAARLIGALALPGDGPALCTALDKEETLFVVPSLLLALGKCGGGHQDAILSYRDSFAARFPDCEEKHRREVLEACSLALSKLIRRERRAFTGLAAPAEVHLAAQPGCGDLLEQEAREKGVEGRRLGDVLIVQTADYPALFALRCFEEALIPLGKAPHPPLDGKKSALESWAQEVVEAASAFPRLLESSFSGSAPYPYRIELRGLLHSERAPLNHALAAAFARDGRLVNAPSSYDAELRLQVSGKATGLFAKLFLPSDPRFSYRLGTLPASIHPVTAACIMRFAQPYFRADARVLDPCCGSGTLLVERAKLMGHGDLVGVDIASEAVSIARKNIRASGESVEILGGDLQKFRPMAPFDELIANLPFGTRVGTHEANSNLYAVLFERLPQLLSPKGVALLYTTQRAPMLRLARANGWKLLGERRFEAGGLQPWALILSR